MSRKNKHWSDEERTRIDLILKTLTYEKDFLNLRARWDKEDELLNCRTNTFLTANALLFAATQLTKSFFICFGVTLIGIILTLFWMIVAMRSKNCIQVLSKFCYEISPKYLQYALDFRSPRKYFPTSVIAKILPRMILICWSVYSLWLMFVKLQIKVI